jgi:hypothetical protein
MEDTAEVMVEASRGGIVDEGRRVVRGDRTAAADTLSRMEPADVTAVPADVVAEVLRDPSSFLDAAAKAAPGWSVRYGGPEGVTELTSVLQDRLAQLTKLNAAVRDATVVYLRSYPKLSLTGIARLLGGSKSLAQKIIKRAEGESTTEAWRFAHLESPDAWSS